ncbi:MAG: hypothetical protein NTY48_02585, partial [Candidatus Diapherotrites archaeon]|nr:hypothetical protein [Candidatus Diapherotrites archaeon]
LESGSSLLRGFDALNVAFALGYKIMPQSELIIKNILHISPDMPLPPVQEIVQKLKNNEVSLSINAVGLEKQL